MAETLVVVAQHRNQYYGKSKGHGPARFGSFGSPPSKDFRGINCRTFQSGAGLLPTPVKQSYPVSKRASSSFSPKTPLPYDGSRSEEPKKSKKFSKTSSIPIPVKLNVDVDSDKPRSAGDQLHFSERWAGPTYYNSPPPSSLPIPKFSLRPKRTVSLDLPSSISDIDLHPVAKSAPTSPTRERSPSPDDLFGNRSREGSPSTDDLFGNSSREGSPSPDDLFGNSSREGSPSPGDLFGDSIDFATKALCRILNLDLSGNE